MLGFMQLQKIKTKLNLLNTHPRQAAQTSDRQVRSRLPTSLPAHALPTPRQSQRCCQASRQQEVKEGREEDVHHVRLPDRSPADATCGVGAAGTRSQAGERAAMAGLNLENHKKPWKAFGIKASFIPRHKQVAVMESPFVTEGQSTTASWEQQCGLCSRVYLKTSTNI